MRTLCFSILVTFPILLFADPWDCFSEDEAVTIQNYLYKNPFLVDYCDCCDHKGPDATKVYLMKVLHTEKIICEYDTNRFSVMVGVKIIAEIPNSKSGLLVNKPIPWLSKDNLIVSLNYTWGYCPERKLLAPLQNILDIPGAPGIGSDKGDCKAHEEFPNPFKTKDVIMDKAYREWYRKTFLDK